MRGAKELCWANKTAPALGEQSRRGFCLASPAGALSAAGYYGGYCFLNNAAVTLIGLPPAVYGEIAPRRFKPRRRQSLVLARRCLVVSFGADTFEEESILRFRLTGDDSYRLGEALAAPRLPTLFVLEDGYAIDELGRNVATALFGFDGA